MVAGMKSKESTLAKKAVRGNPKAFGELVRGCQDYLYKMAYLQTRDEQDALDAVQESILKAYKSIGTLKNPELFQTWLTRIVINTARDGLRRKKPETPLEEGEESAPPDAISTEEKMDLYDALERLPEKYRDVVALKYFDGLTIREISRATGMPEGTVSVYLSRALKVLKSDLKEELA